MLRGLYTAATGMINQSRRLDAISNNIANADTTGFKKDRNVNRAFADELLIRTGKDNPRKAIGTYSHGVYVDRVLINFEQGNLEQTHRSMDFAVKGEGFFTVQTEDGVAYTRDGGFTVDAEGYLVTTEGHQVLGEDGPIIVGSEDFRADAAGNIFASGSYLSGDGMVTAGEAYAGRLRIVSFNDPQALEKTSNNLYISRPEAEEMPFEGEVMQGFLEGSNVDVLGEMVSLITASRNYETNQRIISMMDESLGKTVNEVGRV